MTRFAVATLALLWLGACTPAAAPSVEAPVATAAPATLATAAAGPLRWKALAASGDDSIPVFDNAVDRFTALMVERNVVNLRHYTSTESRVEPDRPLATVAALDQGLRSLTPGPGEACLIFLTSHGARNGLLLKQDLDQNKRLNPARFGRMMDDACGPAPTVAIVSGCFTGVFLSRFTEAPNRIILTAARRDRTSFGCSAEQEFTYFDACLFDAWPLSGTWEVLFDRTADCVRAKEWALNFQYSEPQAWFGDNMRNVTLP